MYLPERLVQLMNHHGNIVESRKCNNTVIAGECSALCQAGEMRVETKVVLHERLEVLSVLLHVVDDLSSVEEVIVGVAVQLVSQRSEQTVPVSWYLFESEAQGAQLVVQTGEIVKIIGHLLLLFLVPPVGSPDLSLNSLFGHSPPFLKMLTADPSV